MRKRRAATEERRAAALLHAGVMDVAGLGVMAGALAVAVRAASSARRGAAALAAGGPAR
jgi:hypothetical protein